ncbi:terpene synthase family protein [[Flexibacter] sp. ATCC 35208]|uniref:terpene synthase family protein n=1 Tax=[Flexibacter] sp. ATCC 35208 TaxID=1936242 RepID=UPI0009CA1E16|nr:terpene synthase family protein [[Flexibacter] sp. ATCC 35208]OMP80027.1 hypothetical protein BW716_05920 [[Flexibacter] sp. ATCC 35208]
MQIHKLSIDVPQALNRVKLQYEELLNAKRSFSLHSIFNCGKFQFDEYCNDFAPHTDTIIKNSTASFGERYQILLPDADAYITCCMFLFPNAPQENILLLSKNYAVDFYLNDKMGRDVKPSSQEMKELYEIRDRLATLTTDLKLYPNASAAEIANIEVLKQISDLSPSQWFNKFLKQYLNHIDIAHQPYDIVRNGNMQSIEDYIRIRVEISGMPHTVTLIEFAHSNFLDWELLESIGLADDMRKLNEIVSYVGALTNDFFSFEKEVIDRQSDSNLIFVVLINNFRMRLDEAIEVAGHIISNLLNDYENSLTQIRDRLNVSNISEVSKNQINKYLNGLKSVLQACWTWQTYTQRYKRTYSLWEETRKKEAIII